MIFDTNTDYYDTYHRVSRGLTVMPIGPTPHHHNTTYLRGRTTDDII